MDVNFEGKFVDKAAKREELKQKAIDFKATATAAGNLKHMVVNKGKEKIAKKVLKLVGKKK